MTSVPSYDDLTPGIPDVVDSEQVDQLALFLGASPLSIVNAQLPTSAARESTAGAGVKRRENRERHIGSLYACLRDLEKSPDPIPQFPNSAIPQFPNTLVAIARDFSPRVMVASERDVLLDVSGLGRLIGEPPAITRELARAIGDAGLNARVALAATQTAARLLATQSAGSDITQLPDLPVLLLQPLETLPPAMTDRERARPYETLERWGIQTLGDLAALPAAELSSRLGRRGAALQRLARGLDPRPFVPDPGTPRFVASVDLEWPIDALEPLSFIFARLLDPLSASLERADRGAVAVRLDLRLTDKSTHTRILPLPAPMRDARVLRTLLLLDLESSPLSAAVDAVTIEVDPAPARITQFSLLQRALPSPETVSTLIARLSALVGASRVGSAALLDTHAPDAFAMARFSPASVVADSPTGGSVLRQQRHTTVLRVAVEHGRPVHIASSRRGIPYGAIVQAAGPWRSSGAWWNLPPKDGSYREERGGRVPRAGNSACGPAAAAAWNSACGPAAAAAWNRDEWDVALKSGAVCRIYQDRTTDRWFLEGVYD